MFAVPVYRCDADGVIVRNFIIHDLNTCYLVRCIVEVVNYLSPDTGYFMILTNVFALSRSHRSKSGNL